MSRGGRGRGGGRGGFRGRGNGFGSSIPPMGLTFADIQAMSREGDALYPPLDPLPVLADYSDVEKKICELQNAFTTRLRKSAYYVVEPIKSNDIERYSDKYRQTPASQPTLRRKDLHAPFFPQDIFEGYFNPKKKRKGITKAKHLDLDELADEAEDQEKSGDERSDAGSQPAESDYDVEEEYDNDYADNYFDNGEGDDLDDLGGGGGDDGGGGGKAHLCLLSRRFIRRQSYTGDFD
ncbi:DNA-directed RNA polymerase III, subunit Rpc31 [Phlebopus sp. FC_14]|nr:DNA-directed RNA polymerase III, subunit Rpc31 [Phlebopus sp. FC_14]